MNYVAHALVANELNPNADEAYIFGAMAPDLVGMAGTKLVRHSDNKDLADGVELHIATDSVFDANPLFTAIKSQFRPIHEEYLSRGAARTCADVGTEMLLDGYVLQKNQAVEVYGRTVEAAAGRAFPLGQVALNQAALIDLVDKSAEIGSPFFYQEPSVVAERLYRRLRARERLCFEEGLIPQVAETFLLQQQAIGRVANGLIEQTVDRLSTAQASPDIGPIATILPGLSTSVQKIRLSNFEDGRTAATQALKQSGFDGEPIIGRSPKGVPLFPDGYIGSISHTRDWAIAITARASDYTAVGVDIEAADRHFKTDIAKRVSDDVERAQFSDFGGQDALVISSLKEAIYKALFPKAQRWIGFHEVSLRRIDANTTEVKLLADDLAQRFANQQISTVMLNDSKWHTSVCLIS